MPTPRTIVLVFVLIAGSCLPTAACRARPTADPAAPFNPHIIAHLGGSPHGLVVDGNRAYFGHGPRLAVADVSRPWVPGALAESAPMGGAIRDVVLARGWIVALLEDAVQIVDIGRPSRPVLRGRFAVSDTLVAVAAGGRTAYLLAKGGRLHVVDLRRPDAPTEVARVDGLGGATDVALSGTMLYVTGAELTAVDVRDSRKPVVLGRAPIKGDRVFVAGGRAHVEDTSRADHFSWLQEVDVRDPTAMRGLREERSRFITDLVAGGRRLFIVGLSPSGGRGPCCTLDVRDRRQSGDAAAVGSLELSASGLGDLALAGRWLYVLGWDGGLRVVDVARPGAPVEVGALPIMSRVHDVAVEGHVAYAITGQMNGGGAYRNNRFLDALDLSEPAAPQHVGRLPLGGVGHRLAVAGGRAIVMGDGGLGIMDVADPSHPGRLGGWNAEVAQVGVRADRSWWSDVVVSGDDVWLTDVTRVGYDMGSLVHLDVSEPSSPRLVERIMLNTEPVAIALLGDRLYVAGSRDRYGRVSNAGSGIRIFERTRMNAVVGGVRQVGNVALPGGVSDVAVSGDRLYVLDGALRIFDLRAPAAPQPRGTLTLAGDVTYSVLAVDGTTAYLGAGYRESAVLVVDAADADAPRVVDEITGLPGQLAGMAVGDAGVVAALGEGGRVGVRGR